MKDIKQADKCRCFSLLAEHFGTPSVSESDAHHHRKAVTVVKTRRLFLQTR